VQQRIDQSPKFVSMGAWKPTARRPPLSASEETYNVNSEGSNNDILIRNDIRMCGVSVCFGGQYL